MADGIVGTLVTFPFRTGVSGESFSVDAIETVQPDGSAWTPTITPVGDAFELSFTPDEAGVWQAVVGGVSSGRVIGVQFHILAAPSRTFTRVTPGQTVRSSTLNELQQRLEELPF